MPSRLKPLQEETAALRRRVAQLERENLVPEAASERPTPLPWGHVWVRDLDSAADANIYGTAPNFRFRALLWELEAARAAGAADATLTGERLETVHDALRTALHYYDEIEPRDFFAFTALNNPGVPHNERLRTFANRMLGRPDRDRGPRGAVYDAAAIVSEYAALTGQGEGSTARYATRTQCGLPMLPPCEWHTEGQAPRVRFGREGCQRCGPHVVIRPPLSREDAVRAIQHVHGFASYGACMKAIQRAIVRANPIPRPRLPGTRRDI